MLSGEEGEDRERKLRGRDRALCYRPEIVNVLGIICEILIAGCRRLSFECIGSVFVFFPFYHKPVYNDDRYLQPARLLVLTTKSRYAGEKHIIDPPLAVRKRDRFLNCKPRTIR